MPVQDKKFITQSRRLMQLYHSLIEMGFKNKDISHALGIYPSAFSNFINRVLKEIILLDIDDTEGPTRIRAIFEGVNNISELKTRQRIDSYIQKLEALKLPPSPQTELMEEGLPSAHVNNSSTPGIMKMLEGNYACYYISTFGYKIKKEPFLIAFDHEKKNFRIRKGNALGPSEYEGTGYLSNSHLFTIQIKEKNTLVQDNFIAHFQLPPFYSSAMNLLKGISISMSNAFMPIARKIILLRTSNSPQTTDYDEMKTEFYEKENSPDHEIIAYLHKQNSFMEYVAIPHPNFTSKDLSQELKISALM